MKNKFFGNGTRPYQNGPYIAWGVQWTSAHRQECQMKLTAQDYDMLKPKTSELRNVLMVLHTYFPTKGKRSPSAQKARAVKNPTVGPPWNCKSRNSRHPLSKKDINFRNAHEVLVRHP